MTERSEAVQEALGTLPAFVRRNQFETTESGHLSLSSGGPAQKRVPVGDPGDALLITASRGNGQYALLLDIDIPVEVVKSSSGNTHLYFDVALPRWRHNQVISALAEAGIVQPTWAKSATENPGGSHLRPPWVKKGSDATLNQRNDPWDGALAQEDAIVDAWTEALTQ